MSFPTTKHVVDSYILIIAACLLVIVSYLFNPISKKTGIPSVLMLLISGIVVREVLTYTGNSFAIPTSMVELFGILGLIMIILEAGLDLSISKKKLRLVRNAFFSSLVILVFSTLIVSAFLFYYLKEDYLNCLIYAIPLSVVSSAIVIPSISHLGETKKEFLVYETSFSDILGILLFNYMIAGNLLQGSNITWFFASTVIALMAEQEGVTEKGGTMRLGAYDCELAAGSLVARIYGKPRISDHRHRFEFNNRYRERLEKAGLRLSGVSPDGSLVEMIELAPEVHPFFVGCQFHPEFKSRPTAPHPLFSAYIAASLQYQRTRT